LVAQQGALLLDMQRIMAWNLVLEFAHVRRFALDGWERLVEVAAPLFGKTARDVEVVGCRQRTAGLD
jgi:hypothetical protein